MEPLVLHVFSGSLKRKARMTVSVLTYTPPVPMVLASGSPRRAQLLRMLVPDFEIIPAEADETIPPHVPPEATAALLAERKAKAVAALHPQKLILGCDTVVIAQNRILGKPRDQKECMEFLQLLEGAVHRVITGCALVRNGELQSFSVGAEVRFFPMTEAEIEAYALTPEPYDKAGGYGIQGTAALFIQEIRGDYYTVMGLPVSALRQILLASEADCRSNAQEYCL